jgi:hypothetical protein
MNVEAIVKGYEAIASMVPPQPTDAQRLIASKCRALLVGYHARWGDPAFAVLGVEQLVQADLYNPETQARSRTFSVAAKLDLIGDREGRRMLMDHKTTSEDVEDPNSSYWRQLVVEAQPSHYLLLEWLNGRKCDETVWDVMRKPDIRPKQVAKKDRDGVVRYRHYFGAAISDESIREMEETDRETLEMYEARLINDCATERPAHYFQRRTVPRLDADIHEHAKELWDYSQEIIQARRNNRHPRNAGACMTYGRPCTYLGICSGYDTVESDNWRKKEQVHNELELTGTDGRDVLTNSRLTVFKSCRRKHFLQYELGIERIAEEDAESLWFGSCWHHGLDAYFSHYKQQGESNVNYNVPATEVGIVRTADAYEAEI